MTRNEPVLAPVYPFMRSEELGRLLHKSLSQRDYRRGHCKSGGFARI